MIHIIEDVRNTHERIPDLVLTVGSFDGVHLGHRAILEETVRQARARGGCAGVLTLRPHPREFFSPEHAPSMLTCDRKKWQLFEDLGIDVVFILAFNAEVAALEPEKFVEEIIHGRCGAVAVVVGHDFRFGKGARGDFELLRNLSPRFGFKITQVAPLLMDGERVSSTLIRERLFVGDLEKAQAFLGRPYSIVGEVVSGRRVGSTLGFPTANIRPHHTAVPAQGVYVCEVLVGGACYPAAVNIGVAPTIRDEEMSIEAHLLDFSGNLEGRELEVVFHKRLRPEIKFATIEDLIAQIRRDIDAVRQYCDERKSAAS